MTAQPATGGRVLRRTILSPTPTSDGLDVIVDSQLARKFGAGVDPDGHSYLADPRWLLIDEGAGPNGCRSRIEALIAAEHLNLEGAVLVPYESSDQ